MADPIGLSMVVSSALPATFAFLYQHLDVLLSRHRGNTAGTSNPEVPGVPAVFAGELELPLRADEDRVSARVAELRAYALGLDHYQRDPSLIDSGDLLLMQALSGCVMRWKTSTGSGSPSRARTAAGPGLSASSATGRSQARWSACRRRTPSAARPPAR